MDFNILSLAVFLYMIELAIEKGNSIILGIIQFNGPFGLRVRQGEESRVE